MILPGLLLWALACAPDHPGPPAEVLAEAWIGLGELGEPGSLGPLLAGSPVTTDGPGPDGRWRVLATSRALDELRGLGASVQVTHEDHRTLAARAPGYHDPDQMLEALEALAEAWPEEAELIDIGRSVQGRSITGLRIGSGDWRVRLLGAHHGDELSSAEVTLAAARWLLAELPSAEVWVIPHINPDGVAAGSRYNARDVDLNRNYGYKWSADEFRAGDQAFSEPESRAVRVLSSYRSFASGLSLHSGAALVCYVWNYTTSDSSDEPLLASQADAYADECELGGFYAINGGGWYVTHGDTTDWSYGQRGTLDYTLEVSVDKTPPAGQLDQLIHEHQQALRSFVQRPPELIGRVLDAQDGLPLEAVVTVGEGRSVVAGPDGRFARHLETETVELVVNHPGFAERVVELTVQPGQSKILEVELEREGLLDLRPETVILSWSDQQRSLWLPGVEDSSVVLWRHGFDSVSVTGGSGRYDVNTSLLEPGPWGVTTAQGSLPRAFFVGERDDEVQIQDVDLLGDELLLDGHGFGRGSRAWVVSGEARSMTPLALLGESSNQLGFDAAPLAALAGPLDLIVVSNGAQLAVADVAAGWGVDTGEPRDSSTPWYDSGDSGGGLAPGGGGCGCGSSPPGRVALALFLVTLARATVLARRRWNPAGADLSDGSPRHASRPGHLPGHPGARMSSLRRSLRRLSTLIPLALLPTLWGCQDEDFGEASFYENVYDAYSECRASEIKFLTGKHGIQTAFEECGSNNFGSFAWSPDGLQLYFQVTHAGHVLHGEDKTITTVPTPLPVSNGLWLDADRLLFLLPQPEADIPGQRVAVYDHRKTTTKVVDTELLEPAMLQPGADAQHVHLTALDAEGVRRPYALDITTGVFERAFPWIEQPVDSFTYEPDTALVTWGVGDSAYIADAKGEGLLELTDAKRAVLHPAGRWVLLERHGAPVSNFDQTAWDEMSDEARERAVRRRDAWAERLPEWTDTETRPPSLDLFDRETGKRYRFTEFQGDLFEWYRARDHYVSFRMWGIEEKELNKNIALVDLTDRMRMLDRGTYPLGIELVQPVPEPELEPEPTLQDAAVPDPAD